MNLKPYKLHPYPWTLDRNHIKNADGDVIASVPYTLGDEIDHSSGRLMARAPELLDLISLTLCTIGDVLRSEPDLMPSNKDVLESISQDLRSALNDQEGGKQ
jgi:hypothetical protein